MSSAPRLVVGVGASAGGLAAFKELLSALPDDTGMAFLLVQHLESSRPSMLVELLQPCTGMPVRPADGEIEIRPNTVYVIRPNTALAVRDGRIELDSATRQPVDHLFSSLARAYGPSAAGVVLSGAGTDGSAGVRDIKAAGGLVLVQNPESSGQSGMPRSALAAGVIDLAVEIDEIPGALQRFADLPLDARIEPPEGGDEERAPPTPSQQQHEDLAAVIIARSGFDLTAYKPGTIGRRVLRRMALSGFARVDDYLDHLRQDAAERQKLVRDLLISVTNFFRDPEAFVALRHQVLERLVAGLEPGDKLRVWVPGCATGEEAYSLAMELLDAIAASDTPASLQVFATDADSDALAVGRAGHYPAAIAERVGQRRLDTYFDAVDGEGYRVKSALRDVVSFAVHDLTRDPPFSRMQLVSCRNVLIYLTPEGQRQVLQVLHFALEPDGYLFLGTSESTAAARDLFSTVSKPHRIFQKVGQSRPVTMRRGGMPFGAPRPGPYPRRTQGVPRQGGHDLARRAVLDAWVPPTVVVSEDGTVLFMHGELGPYLRFPQGEHPRLELGSLLRPELATRTRAALHRCRRSKEPVEAISSPDAEHQGRVRITAKPALELGDDAVMVTFEDVRSDEAPPLVRPETPAQEALVGQLEAELRATREDLRNTVEALEASNEELRSSNEEAMSANEELQSANEELEATSEELRSLNEELSAVNVRLREKVEEIEQAHDDLNNFFSSTRIATLFLDDGLRVVRFTPAARSLLDIDEPHIGRFIGDVHRELLERDLEAEVREVLERLSTRTREIRTNDGRWISRQVLPYRTETRHIEGVVITFVDVTELKAATERLAVRERQQAVIASAGLRALRESNLQVFMDSIVREVQQTLDTDFCKLLELQPAGDLLLRAGVGWRPGLVGTTHVGPGIDSQSGYTLQAPGPVIVDDLRAEKRFTGSPLLVEHGVVSGVSCVIREGDHDYGVLGAHTTRPRAFGPEDANFLQAIAAVVGSAVARHQTRIRLAVELAVAHVLAEAPSPDEALPQVLERTVAELQAAMGEVWWPSPDGRTLSCRERYVRQPRTRGRVGRFSDRTFEVGQGLVGRVYEEQRATWCADLADPAMFERGEQAAELGLVSAVGLPISAGSEVLGVLLVLSSDRMIGDPVFLRSLEVVGRAIGDFVARWTYEQRARRLAAITESSHDAILSYDDEGHITEWLPGSERLFGWTAEEMVGRSFEHFVPDERRDELKHVHERVRRGEVVEPFETVRLHKDGHLVDVSVVVSPVRDSKGRVVGISATDRDVTVRKENERRLVAADRQKDEFLAMLGHELRNPLAAIRSAAEVLKLIGGDEPNLRRTQEILERQTSHMAKLLDGLLDVSRIIRGKIRLEREVVDFAAVCREVVTDVSERLGGRMLDIRIELPPRPVWVLGDPVRLTQIVDNLLSNAIKYTRDDGLVTILLERMGDEAVLTVRDTGVGIEADLLPYVFEVFRQSEQSLDRSYGGLGLGLALVKSLVDLHGGSVDARSEGKNRGAEFVVRLPTTSGPRRHTSDGRAHERRPVSVLLVEDSADAADMLSQLLRLNGHEVAVASTGRQGLDMARENRPDVVLCDLGLPDGFSGFDVAQAIRADPALRSVRLVALSGYGRPEDKERGVEAGFDAHITKPVDVEVLERMLAEVD